MSEKTDISLRTDAEFARMPGTVEVEPGTYWTAQVALDAGRTYFSSGAATFTNLTELDGEPPENHHTIPAGQTHLIERVKLVEGVVHTVVLMGHPRIGTDTSYEILVQEFLRWFSPEHEVDAVRARELAALQGRVNDIQREISDRQNDPAHDRELLAAAGIDATPLLAGPAPMTGSALIASAQGITQAQLEAAQQQAELHGKLAEAKGKWLTAKTGEIGRTLNTMGEFYKEKGAAELAKTQDIQRYVKNIQKGLTSLNLYTGKDVEVTCLRDGEEAPSGTPLTVYQRKLFVDEETLINHAMGGADFRDLKKFGEALRSDESLVKRLLPTERCVVLMAWRRYDKHYEADPITAAMMNDANRKAFLLLRNGERIYQIFSEVSTANSTVLFPKHGEISDAPFAGTNGQRITIDSVRFSEALDAQAAAILHYRRLLILLWGLNDREGLLGTDFHDPRTDPKFLSLEFQEKRFAFVADAEDVLPSNMPPLAKWIAEKNSYLQSGSRVLCRWGALLNPKNAPGCYTTYDFGAKYERRYEPKNDHDTVIVAKDGQDLIVSPEVHGYSYTAGKDRSFTARVQIERGDYDGERGFSFLVLDTVRPEEIDWYLNSRVSRQHYLQFVELFISVRDALRVERAAELPMRDALAADVAAGLGNSGEEVAPAIEMAIQSWRAARRGKPLPGPGEEAEFRKARHALLDQIFVHLGGGADPVAQAAELAAAAGRAPLRLALTGRKKFVLYAEPRADERCDQLMVDDPWAVRVVIDQQKSGWSVVKEERVLLPDRAPAAEKVLQDWPGATAWSKKPVTAIPYDLMQMVARECSREKCRERWDAIMTPLSSAEVRVAVEQAYRDTIDASRKYVVRTRIQQPVALLRHTVRGNQWNDGVSFHLLLQDFDLYELIYRRAAPEDRPLVEHMLVSHYKNKESNLAELRNSLTRPGRLIDCVPLAHFFRKGGGPAPLKALLDPERRWTSPGESARYQTARVETFEEVGGSMTDYLTKRGTRHGNVTVNQVEWL